MSSAVTLNEGGADSTSPISIDRPVAGVAVVTLQRPANLNAFNKDLLWALHDAVDELSADRDTRVVILTGAGRAFSAGLDLNEGHFEVPGTESMAEVPRLLILQKRFTDLLEKIRQSPKPFIAAVHGPATGGGMAVALACDIRVVTAEAKFGAVFMAIGATNTDLGISYLLPRFVGAARSAEILLTGRLVGGQEAERIGIATHLVARDELQPQSIALASAIAAHGAFQVWMTKETMWQTLDAPSFRHAVDMENRTQIMTNMAGDVDRAFEAFTSGGTRKIEWKAM
ncbi:enoyl-CoA hydratase [Mycolicibacterium mucogenicum]|uniref:Enoyl-CoA hydratase n=1 Tax=Mycolicibacterium mucogenicum TaxID=56689 RepID=A0A1A3HDV0_MYCMU|nr:enoyl-CoA hydratase/isomerase family protein [Mycolicibacterium mucogenicum]OBJ46447.1 enoyl-CoA hydratase [Mycolicibacterium mucogenicum]